MRAGELRHRITIQQNDPIQDSFNAVTENWIDVATVWAKVETISGTEFIAQQAAAAALSHKITLRDRSDVTPAMRVNWNDRILEIMGVLRDNRLHEMQLMCSESGS